MTLAAKCPGCCRAIGHERGCILAIGPDALRTEAPLFGNSRITNCANCGRIVVGNRLCQCVTRRHVPTVAERAAFFNRAGTSVAQHVGRGPTLTDRLLTRAALAFYRAFVAVNEWRKERK